MISSLRVYDIVFPALQMCDAVAYGEPLDPDLAKTAIQQLNLMRATDALGFVGYNYFDATIAPNSSTSYITLGTGGDIPSRPAKIEQVTAIIGGLTNILLPLQPLEQYRSLPYVAVYSVPKAVYLETGFPLTKLWFYPGIQAGYSVRVTGLAYPTDYENITDTVADPPEYVDYYISALAVRMAPMLGKPADGLIQRAHSAKKKIKAAGFSNRAQQLSPRGVGFSFLAGL